MKQLYQPNKRYPSQYKKNWQYKNVVFFNNSKEWTKQLQLYNNVYNMAQVDT